MKQLHHMLVICAFALSGGLGAAKSCKLGKLYVTSPNGSEILRFNNAGLRTGDAVPDAVITSKSYLKGIRFVYLDQTNNALYVAGSESNKVVVFNNISALASGDLTPDRTIGCSSLDGPLDLAVDPSSDELYVVNSHKNNILVFANASTLNSSRALPSRTIASNPPFNFPHGLLLDTTNDRLFVADLNNNAVKVFDTASSLNGTVSPNRTLTGIAQPISIRINAANELVVGTRQGNAIYAYANADTVNGAAVWSRRVYGSTTTLDHPHQVFYVAGTDELYVANAFAGAVNVFSGFSAATGDVAPSRTICGPSTSLSSLWSGSTMGTMGCAGVAVDTTR